MTVTAGTLVRASVLGPVAVRREGLDLDLGAPRQRAVVAALALHGGRPVSVDTVVDLVWGERPPPGVATTLQGYVSHLRRAVEPERERRAPARVLVTVGTGYAWQAPVDAGDFERVVERAHARLRTSGPTLAPDADEAQLHQTLHDLEDVLAGWRGTPYAELGDAPAAVAERARLEELLLVAREDRAVAGLALGRHQTVAAELETLIQQHPLRERLWALQAVALTRAGRQAEALDQLRRLREVLDEELGLVPSPEVRDLQAAILRQDPELDWTPPRGEGFVPGTRHGAEVAPAGGATALGAPPVAPWPMTGRDSELQALVGQLRHAATGTPSYAVITGDPGIGKSRLAGELTRAAREAGAQVLIGRCSQDDGAPPLWPWKHVLGGLGSTLEEAVGVEDGGQFGAWERVSAAVLSAAAERLTVVVLDDLHWADPSSLRVLRLLLERAAGQRLLLVATWRPSATPTADLAVAADALARVHALRIELSGLPHGAVADLFEAVSSTAPSQEQAVQLRERTDGNPFFLVEYARLAGQRDLARLLTEEHPPAAVSEVIARRVDALPEQTVTALRAAAVVGRFFETAVVASATGVAEDDVLDRLDPALAAGLLREDGVDRFLFAHALVRDTLVSSMPASRRARLHVRIASALEGIGGRETEVAGHWLAGGPAYAARAWRAAVAAAAAARRLYAYDDEVRLWRSALDSLAADPEATPRQRYDLLTGLIEACRWAADLPGLVAGVEEGIAVGKQLRDPVAVARAAIATTQSVLWRSAPPGEVNVLVVDALRGTLDRLPPDEDELRSRTLIALAIELGQHEPYADREALVAEGLAIADQIGEEHLLVDVLLGAATALIVARSDPQRLGWITRALELARAIGDDRGVVVAGTMRAVALSELGRPQEMLAAAASARADGERQRILFGPLILDELELPWRVLAGDTAATETILARMQATARQISHGEAEEALVASLITVRMSEGRVEEVVPLLEEFVAASFPFTTTIATYLCRTGDLEGARAYYRDHGAPLEHDNEVSLLAWCHAGELALHLGEPDLGRAVLPLIEPYAGRTCSVGQALTDGPVDAYLACAAAAAGELELADQHARATLRLAEEWRIPAFGARFAELRRRYRF
ncbi:BTAD domain-containing putative transcriptional regulator [Nocardioides sp. BP30]|uniref:AfsR/SARP family transcriptional regulator n=1 Tax=Nocardioides sp. BP30 TaxID=3036374 RepID=UPI002469B12E|nr:AfsR/SARP family transcriptional regulator [Nocardioides sp. BP30]WGL52371.1 BTAD domain-containing putative transcriptional regulator [Nocardioides sp. BP30]